MMTCVQALRGCFSALPAPGPIDAEMQERFLRITGDAQDAHEDALAVTSSVRRGESPARVARLFERLLLEADGLHSEHVRMTFDRIRRHPAPDPAEKAFASLARASRRDAVKAWDAFDVLTRDPAVFPHLADDAQLCADILKAIPEAEHHRFPQALERATRAPQPEAFLRRLHERVTQQRSLTSALSDLDLLEDPRLASIPEGERTSHLDTLRAAGLVEDAQVHRALDLVKDGASPRERRRVARKIARMAALEEDASLGLQDVEWLIADEGVHQLPSAAPRFRRLLAHATPEQREIARDLAQLTPGSAAERREEAVRVLLALEPSLALVQDHLHTVERGRQADETLEQAARRYREMLMWPELDDPTAAREAFPAASTAFPVDDPGPAARWRRFHDLSGQTRSVRHAADLWRLLTKAPDARERAAREKAWESLLTHLPDQPAQAVSILAASSRAASGEGSAARVAETVLELLQARDPQSLLDTCEAADLWRDALRPDLPDPADRVRHLVPLFTAGESDPVSRQDVVRAVTVFGAPGTLRLRIDLLRGLVTATDDRAEALRHYEAFLLAFADLPPDAFTADAAQAWALLVKAFEGRGDLARDLLTWVITQGREDPLLAGQPAADLIGTLATTALLHPDAEAARKAFLANRPRPVASDPVPVQVDDDAIVVGGIRIPRRTPDPTPDPDQNPKETTS